jgi:Lanthionine synthetase C-like protein
MIEQSRHVPLRATSWDPGEAAKAIDEIISDALGHFDDEAFWPAHPLDGEGAGDGFHNIYFGAAGMIWALDYLRRLGGTKAHFDFGPILPRLLEATRANGRLWGYAVNGSLLLGDLGTAMLTMRLAPTAAIAEAIHAHAHANTQLPVRELMWGMPGSMLACIYMAEVTSEPRWRLIFDAQAERLLSELTETDDGPLWVQDLYGRQVQYLGPVHGYAGNMIPLMRAWDWLAESQRARVADAVPRTLSENAWRTDLGTSWHGTVRHDKPPWRCQHCHGAPGMVTTFADAPFTSPQLEQLLIEGGKFIWAAGPLAKGSNLCHGTAGNGYAFLKLHCRTGDPIWLERARAFAMTAIAQSREARDHVGRGRYSLWTGDAGLAVYLWDCLTAVPRFPTVDVF